MTKTIKPQPTQEKFLSSSADIVIFGGSAGGGKTYAMLLEPLRHKDNPNFGAVIFRRESTQITNEGGLWDTSETLYPFLGAVPRTHPNMDWKFPSGARVSFRHLNSEKTIYAYQGSQIPLICFDELTHFSKKQFFYMLSRNRSTCGVAPYVRAGTNPDPDSWVATFIEWWIDQKTGYAIPERSGVVRWLYIIDDKYIWGDSKEELMASYGSSMTVDGQVVPPKSVTFILSSVSDNKELLKADPGYMANLMSLDFVERERLLSGNWKIKNNVARVFNRWVVQEFEAPADAEFRFGADWGFSTDPTVLIRAYIIGRKLYIDYEAYQTECEILDTPALFMTVPESDRYPIIADSARPETISHMRKNGFPKIMSAIKGAKSVDDGIEWLKTYDIIVHPRCVHTIQELKLYSYKIDSMTGDVLPVLEDKNNHLIDALRYACEGVRRVQTKKKIDATPMPSVNYF